MATPMRDGAPAGGPRPPPPLPPARPDHPANFEYDDNEWDVGIGDLIIDLDADIEKTDEARSGMASVPRPERAPDAPRSALKMKIKRTKPGTKTSEAKHEIVKSNEANGSASAAAALGAAGEPGTADRKGAKHAPATPTPASPAPLPSPASAINSAAKRGSGAHRKDKAREKHPPSGVDLPANAPPVHRDMNGVARPFAGPGPPSVPASTPSGAISTSNTTTMPAVSVPTDVSSVSAPVSTAAPVSAAHPPSASEDTRRSTSPAPPPAKKQKTADVKNDSEREATVDACVGTSVGTITEPDCLGPCEPGTSVTLEGIVWHETEGGVLVVNVTWRGKTYVGTLLDCTRHDWAPPRFCDSPTEELDSRTVKGRGAKRGRTAPGDLSNFTETRSSMHSKLRNGGKGRRAAASPTPFTPPRTEVKRKEPTAPPAPSPLLKPKRVQPQPTPVPSPPSPPLLLECPEPNCSKKYKNVNGLRYHRSHAHGTPDDDDVKDGASCSENDESNTEAPSPAPAAPARSPDKPDVTTSSPPLVTSPTPANANPSLTISPEESPPPDITPPSPAAQSETPTAIIRPMLAPVSPFRPQSPVAVAPSNPPTRPQPPQLGLPLSPNSAVQPQVTMLADVQKPSPELHSPVFKSKTLNTTEEDPKSIDAPQADSPLPKRNKMRKSPGSPNPSDRTFGVATAPPGRDEVCSPAYSDISDDAAPTEVEPDKTKEMGEDKSDTPSPRAMPPGYGVYQFFGQPPFIVPTGQPPPPIERMKPKDDPLSNLPESKPLGEREPKREGPPDASNPPQKILAQHFYPYGYVPPGYPYGADVPFGGVPGPGLPGDEKLKEVLPTAHVRDQSKGSPGPADMGGKPSHSQVTYGPHLPHSLHTTHAPSLMHGPHPQHSQHPSHPQHSPHTQHPSHPQHSPHTQHPQHMPHAQHASHPQHPLHPQHSQHPPHPQHPQHLQHPQHPQHSQHQQHPPLKPKPPDSPKDAKHPNENHQILKESIEMKSQMSPYMYQRQQHAHQQQQRDEEMRRYYTSSEQQRRKENPSGGEGVKSAGALPLPGLKPAPKPSSKDKSLPEQELLKPKEEPKPIKQEGQKPTMESTGPPPPPTSQYYLHPSYMQPSHYGALPYDPVYRSLNPMLVSAPFAGPWGGVGLPRYHAPEDLSRPPPPPQPYFPGHKIHELQERALKSPPVKGTGGGPPAPSQTSAPPAAPPAKAPAPQSQTPEPKETSRSPPPQRHVHTHHHTHVGLGYPIYPAPYPAAVLASQQAAAVTVVNPFPATK